MQRETDIPRAAEAAAGSEEKRQVLIKAVLALLSLGSSAGPMTRPASHLVPAGELDTWGFWPQKCCAAFGVRQSWVLFH